MDASKTRLLLFALILFCSNAFGQGEKALGLSQRILFSENSIRLDSLLKKITRQTGLIFSYNTRKVNHGLRFSFSPKAYSIEEVLLRIKEKTGLDYSLSDNHIILKTVRLLGSPITTLAAAVKVDNTEKKLKTASQVADSSKIVNLKKGEKEIKTTVVEQTPLKEEKPIQKINPMVKEEPRDTTKSKSTDINRQLASLNSPTLKKDSIAKNNKSVTPKPAIRQAAKTQLPFQIRAGINVDETLYLGPTIQLGIPAIYATASYKSDFKLGLLSYGLGTSLKLGKTLNLHLQVNTGNTSKFYDSAILKGYDSSSTHRGINAKSNLTRIGFLLEKKLSSRIIFQGGLQYNLLTTKYSGTPIGETGTLCAITPPYLLSNKTNATGDSNVKSWIGFQLNLLYIINFYKKN